MDETTFDLKKKSIPIEYRQMTLGEFNKLKGWNEAAEFKDKGYILKYSDCVTTWMSEEVFKKLHMKELIES